MSRFKFELPAIKGTELWPKQIQAPANVRIGFEFPARFASASKPYLENLAQHLMDQRAGTISHYIQAQRRNYHLGVTEIAATHREIDGLFMAYNNIQGVHETVDLKFTVSEEQLQQLERKSEFQNKLHEHDVESLQVVVFHDGNQVSYAPMSALTKTAGSAKRRILKRSNWGTEIIKTCQVSIGKNFGAIYSELTGFTNYQLSRGTKYYITSSQLYEDRITESYPAAGIAPILNGSNMMAYVGSASVRFTTTGRIRSFVNIPYELDDINQDPIAPWAISSSGARYSAFHLYMQWTNAFRGVGVDLDSVAEDGPNERANYEGFWESDRGLNVPPGMPYWYKLNGSKVSYTPSGEANAAGDNAPPGSNPFPFWSHYDASSTGGAGVPIMEHSGGAAIVGSTSFSWSYSYSSDGAGYYTFFPLAFPETITISQAQSALSESASFDNKSYTNSINYSGLTGTWTINNPPPSPPYPSYMNYLMVLIPFPYNLPGRPCWKRVSQYLQTATGTPVESFISTYETPYGESYRKNTFAPGGFTGWLNISNTQHLIQAYAFYPDTSDRHMYLDGGKISSLLGVPVGAIQTILFDVPLDAIKKFK